MTSDQLGTHRHPTVRLVAGVRELLAEHAGAPVWSMSPGDLAEQLPALAVALNELRAVELAMLRQADRHQVGDPLGHANTAGWWATTTRATKREAHRQVALAERLDQEHHAPTSTALAAGAVSVEQATVILDATDALPTDLVDPALRREAEQHLVGLAEHHDPRELKILGRRILEVIAPEIAEEHERKILEDEERHAAATASFTMSPDGHGSYSVGSRSRYSPGRSSPSTSPPSPHQGTAPPPVRWTGRSPARCDWGRRSPSTSRPAAKTGPPTPAASPPPSWSP